MSDDVIVDLFGVPHFIKNEPPKLGGGPSINNFTTDDLAQGVNNLYSQWEQSSNVLFPKTGLGIDTVRNYASADDTGFELYDQSNALIFEAIQKGADASRVRLYDDGTVRVQLAGAQATGSYIQNTGGLSIGTSNAAPTNGLKVAGVIYNSDGTAAAPSYSYTNDPDSGEYLAGTNQVGIGAGGVSQAIFSHLTTATGSFLELAPSNRTLGSSFSALQRFIHVDGTYTLNAANAVLPVGYDFQATAIFSADGYFFGSGFLFWNHMLVQNSSGSTRTIGGVGSYIDQITIQANGGTFNALFHAGFLGQPTINRINSGVVDMSGASLGVVEFWSNGATIGAGVTIPNYIHFQAGNITNSGTVTTQIGFSAGTLTSATNNTHILIGTPTTGNWGIYQSTSTANYLGGALQVVGDLELDAALNHDGTTVGFYGVTPVVRSSAYTPTNVTTDRSYDANSTTIDELADVLGTLIADLQLTGIIG